MPARSGGDYVESLKTRAPCVYLGGRRVADVTAEPIFQEPIRAIAEQYDLQLDPAYRDVMTYPSPTTGAPVSTSFLVPYYMQYDKAPLLEIVERALGHREGEPLPISPDHPGAPIPYQPGTRGMAGTYAATSMPNQK